MHRNEAGEIIQLGFWICKFGLEIKRPILWKCWKEGTNYDQLTRKYILANIKKTVAILSTYVAPSSQSQQE